MTKNRPTTKELARMRADGMTQTRIGAKYGVSHTAVFKWIENDRDHFDKLFEIYKRQLQQAADKRKAREIAELEAEIKSA